ncbi:MAG TPA: hypothetical protein PKW21_10090 [Rhabdaerophilum sp.]|nr:hypothetical protein [Rhabdaerophilum sp.]
MSNQVNVQLFSKSEDGKSGKSCGFSVDEKFNSRLHGCDWGPRVEAETGDDDYEYWYALKPTSTQALLVALVRDRFGGKPDALAKFRELLEQNNISAEFGFWH